MIITCQDYYIVKKLQRIAERAKERKPHVVENGLIEKLDKKIKRHKN